MFCWAHEPTVPKPPRRYVYDLSPLTWSGWMIMVNHVVVVVVLLLLLVLVLVVVVVVVVVEVRLDDHVLWNLQRMFMQHIYRYLFSEIFMGQRPMITRHTGILRLSHLHQVVGPCFTANTPNDGHFHAKSEVVSLFRLISGMILRRKSKQIQPEIKERWQRYFC